MQKKNLWQMSWSVDKKWLPGFHQSISKSRVFFWFYQLLVLFLPPPISGQVIAPETRKFPELFNAALRGDISTSPTDATCGVPSRSQFCRSSQLAESVFTCSRANCIQDCIYRNTLPQYINILAVAWPMSDDCPVPDFVNKMPFSSQSEYSYAFSSAPKCFLKGALPKSGPEGAFTVTAWLNQQSAYLGYVERLQQTCYHCSM